MKSWQQLYKEKKKKKKKNNPYFYFEHCSIQIQIFNAIEFLHKHSKNKRKRLTSNVTLLGRALDVIGGLHDGNVQILPTEKTNCYQCIELKKTKNKKKTRNLSMLYVSMWGYLEFAVDLGESNLGGVLESSIGFPEGVERPHCGMEKFCL